MGAFVSARLCMDSAVVDSLDGCVVSAPTPAVVKVGIGLLNASRKDGVPNVSVNAMPKTYREIRFALRGV